jgi:hypothetical protein
MSSNCGCKGNSHNHNVSGMSKGEKAPGVNIKRLAVVGVGAAGSHFVDAAISKMIKTDGKTAKEIHNQGLYVNIGKAILGGIGVWKAKDPTLRDIALGFTAGSLLKVMPFIFKDFADPYAGGYANKVQGVGSAASDNGSSPFLPLPYDDSTMSGVFDYGDSAVMSTSAPASKASMTMSSY